MNEMIISCPACGAAVMLAPQISQVSMAFDDILSVTFKATNVKHACKGEH